MMKSCGACKHFIRIKSMQFAAGICSYFDGRTKTDSGKKCNHFKPLKYNRKQKIPPILRGYLITYFI